MSGGGGAGTLITVRAMPLAHGRAAGAAVTLAQLTELEARMRAECDARVAQAEKRMRKHFDDKLRELEELRVAVDHLAERLGAPRKSRPEDAEATDATPGRACAAVCGIDVDVLTPRMSASTGDSRSGE